MSKQGHPRLHSILGRGRPLLVEGTTLYASRGLQLYASDDFGESFRSLAGVQISGFRRLLARSRLASRMGRLGFHGLRVLEDGSMVGIIRGQIVHLESDGSKFRPVLSVHRGLRPLSLALSPSGDLFFGEYFANPRRDSVHVFGSSDGRSWEPIHTFPPGTVRHVHNVVWDTYRRGLWVLTGDDDPEAGIWFTDDNFRNLDAVLRGGQSARAVSVIPYPDGLIVPTDSPRIENAIQLLELPEARLTPLCTLPGSAIHALETAGLYLVSTVAEPSPVNHESGTTLFASLDGENWRRVDRLPPDMLCRILPFARKVLRYPEFALTPGDNDTPFVFGFGRSVRGADGRLIRWSRSEIRDALTDTDHPVE